MAATCVAWSGFGGAKDVGVDGVQGGAALGRRSEAKFRAHGMPEVICEARHATFGPLAQVPAPPAPPAPLPRSGGPLWERGPVRRLASGRRASGPRCPQRAAAPHAGTAAASEAAGPAGRCL